MTRGDQRLSAHAALALVCLALASEAEAFCAAPSHPLLTTHSRTPRTRLGVRCGEAPPGGDGGGQGRRLVVGGLLAQGLLLLGGGGVGLSKRAGAVEVDPGVEGALREAKRKQEEERGRAEQVKSKAARAAAELKEQQEKEAEALKNSDIGKLLLKRTKDNAATNAADVRQKQCVRMCPSKPLGREPVTRMELICEECALEFGVIPGADQYEKKP